MIQLLILLLIIGALADVGRYVIARLRSKKAALPWGAFVLLGLCSLPYLFGLYIDYSASISQPTPRPAPTFTPRPVIINTIAQPKNQLADCLRWSEVTPQMEGQTICVSDRVYSVYSTNQTSTRIKFSNEANTFFVFSQLYEFSDPVTHAPLGAGDCVMLTGTVQLYGNIPYIDIADEPLKQCPK